MAIIQVMPHEAIIDGFKGKIDFYYYCGLVVARKWPRSPGHRRSPAVEAQWARFSYITKQWNTLDAEVRRTYEELATGSGLTGRDMFERAYLKGLYQHPPPS